MRRGLEICVDDAAGIAAAVAGGADRIEVCSALALGGLTPSAGLMALAAEAPIPAFAMIRPRAGGFDWGAEDRRAMEFEVAAAANACLSGVVIGATHDGRLDVPLLRRLIRVARGLEVTLHRCVDLLDDPLRAVDEAADLGITRILTSGGAARAVEGLDRLKAMQDHADGRLSIMPGAGVTVEVLPQILSTLDPSEVHASGSVPDPAQGALAAFGFQPPGAKRTDVDTVRRLRAALA